MKTRRKHRALAASLLALACIPLVAKALCRCPDPPADTRPRGLRAFVDHLDAGGLRLRVVPSRADGRWADNVYLTTDTAATWDTFQLKSQTAQRLDQWWGAVWLHRIGPATDPESRLLAWEGRGRRLGGFLLFGDPVLIERIARLFPGR